MTTRTGTKKVGILTVQSLVLSLIAVPALAQDTGGTLILDESSYCRSYCQFGLDRIDGRAMKGDGEKLLGDAALKNFERQTKNLLASRQIDWSKEDWRDHAVIRFMTLSHSGVEDATMLLSAATPAPPENWTASGFDDVEWPRFRKPFGVGASAGMYFAQWSMTCPGFQAGFYRFHFQAQDPAKAGTLTLDADYVGGIRVFLNGKELGRGHIPSGAVGADTVAEPYGTEAYQMPFTEMSQEQQKKVIERNFKDKEPPKFYGWSNWRSQPGSAVYRARNRKFGPVTIPANLLQKGDNVLAIEIRTAPLNPIVLVKGGWNFSETSQAWLHAALSRLALRASGALVTATSRPPGVQVWVEDMHRRLFSPEFLEPGAGPGMIRLVGARNGTYSAQIAVGADKELAGVQIVPGPLKSPTGATVPPSMIRVQGMVGHPAAQIIELGGGRIPFGERFYTGDGSCFPEAMARERWMPRMADEKARGDAWNQVLYYDHITAQMPAKVPAGICQPYWLSFKVPGDAAAGKYSGAVKVTAGEKTVDIPVDLEILDWRLPDANHLQAIAGIEQSPYGVAKQYNTPLWSDDHFKKIEASLKQLARVGNDWWFVPVILNTEFGNKDDSAIRWSREKDGQYTFDFGIVDRYLDAILKYCGKPRVVSFVVMHGGRGSNSQVKILDKATGKQETILVGGPQHDPEVRQKAFGALAVALYAHMKARGLEDAMHWGYAWDSEGDPLLKPLMRAYAPDVYWTYGAHSAIGGSGGHKYGSSVEYYRSVTEIFTLTLSLTSRLGWTLPDSRLLNPRVLSACHTTEGFSPPFNFHMILDRALVSGYNGLGRIGGDYWANAYFEGAQTGGYHEGGFSILKTLWPGAEGAEPSARLECILAGMQEVEARIFIEQAVQRKFVPEDVAKRLTGVLDRHNLDMLYIPSHVASDLLTEGAPGWLARSRRLYQAASETVKLVALDTERTHIGDTRSDKEKQDESRRMLLTMRHEIVVPSLTQRTTSLRIRNWTGAPRAWKASSSAPWIRLGKTEGTVTEQEDVRVTLDAETLSPGAPATGTITVTDVAANAVRPVAVVARIGKAIELVGKETIYNVTVGSAEKKVFMILNNTDKERDWSLAPSLPWLKAAPAGGKLPPAGSMEVAVTANPPNKEGGFGQAELALAGAGGKAKDVLALSIFTIPAYQPPQGLPAGQKTPLQEAHKQLLVSHRTWSRFRHEPDTGASFGKAWSFWHRDHLVTIGDKTFEMGLWVLPYHETVYKLEGSGYKAFSAQVGINAIVAKEATGHENIRVCFEVHVDGKIAAHSGLIKSTDGPRLLVVQGLDKAKELKLVTRLHDMLYNDGSYRGEFAYSNWADPALYK